MPSTLELAADLAHDIRSPLGAIMCLAAVVESGKSGPVSPAQRRLLRVMREAAEGLSQITSDIVAAGRTRAADNAQVDNTFEIDEVLGAVRHMVQPMAEHAGLNVIVTNAAPRRWAGDRTAVTRVLLNLTTNALKYTDQGVVEYGARQLSPSRLQFFVRDTGGGLVQPGARRTPKRGPVWKHTSSGLGLTISRELLDAMGSTLELDSTPGEGCCFHFELQGIESPVLAARSTQS